MLTPNQSLMVEDAIWYFHRSGTLFRIMVYLKPPD